MAGERERRELVINVIAGLLDGIRHVAVGASSPIPAAGAMLLRARNQRDGKPPVRISILGSQEHNFFTNGAVEVFDCAAQGRVDAFFLGGGQIDGAGNINLVGTGAYPATDVRWPGSFGSAYLYHLVPRVILFREEHSPRVFVPKVDFICGAGHLDGGTSRTDAGLPDGGPRLVVTPLGVFDFAPDSKTMRIRTLHTGVTLEEVRDNTGFDLIVPQTIARTAPPEAEELFLLRRAVDTTGVLARKFPWPRAA